jgi:hypothetical protein
MSAAIKRGLAKPSVRKRMSSSAKRRVENSPGFVEKLRAARALKDAERRVILAAAWRPADWYDRPIDWRIIGTELLSKPSMSNRELGKRLDSSRLIKCPYATTWEIGLTRDGPGPNYVTIPLPRSCC